MTIRHHSSRFGGFGITDLTYSPPCNPRKTWRESTTQATCSQTSNGRSSLPHFCGWSLVNRNGHIQEHIWHDAWQLAKIRTSGISLGPHDTPNIAATAFSINCTKLPEIPPAGCECLALSVSLTCSVGHSAALPEFLDVVLATNGCCPSHKPRRKPLTCIAAYANCDWCTPL